MADTVRSEEEADRIEDSKIQENMDWAEREEKRELEQLLAKKKQAEEEVALAEDPMSDPDNKAWVEKQLAEAKTVYGQDFGEDIEEEFDGG